MKIKRIFSAFLAVVLMLATAVVSPVTATAEEFEEPVIEIIHTEEYTDLNIHVPLEELMRLYERKTSPKLYFNIEIGGFQYIVQFTGIAYNYQHELKPPRIMNQTALAQNFKLSIGHGGIFFRIGSKNPAGVALRKADEYTFTYYFKDYRDRYFYGSEEPITKRINETDIADLDFGEIESRYYTGKARTPAVTVKDGKDKLKKGVDYTVTYKNNVEIGKASAIVKGKGDYVGEKTVYFDIVPAKNALKVKKSGKKLKFSWSSVDEAEKYQIYYSTNGGEYKKLITLDGDRTDCTISALDLENNSYKFKIRSYKEVDGKKYYSPYSKVVKYTKK